MPAKHKFRGYINTLIKEYTNHRIENFLPPPKEEEYVLVITFTEKQPAPNCISAGIELRLRTTEDLTNDEKWATIRTTLSPFCYVKHILSLEIKQYKDKDITIDTYIVGTPTKPIPDNWKKNWQPLINDDKKI